MLCPIYSSSPVKQNYGYSHYKGEGCIHKNYRTLSVRSGNLILGFLILNPMLFL